MTVQRPEQAKVEAAVRTLLRWTGDNPKAVLSATFEEASDYETKDIEPLIRTNLRGDVPTPF